MKGGLYDEAFMRLAMVGWDVTGRQCGGHPNSSECSDSAMLCKEVQETHWFPKLDSGGFPTLVSPCALPESRLGEVKAAGTREAG